MPKHDKQSNEPSTDELTEEQAQEVEAIAKILAEHLYAQPNMTDEQAENDDNSEWEHTSELNKRIFRSCALDVYRHTTGSS